MLTGLCLGSFLATVAVRWGTGRSALQGRSRCPGCGRTLRVFDLVPLAGYLWNRGRCRGCGSVIRPFYPLAELAAGAVGALAFALLPVPVAGLAAGLGWYLLLLALIDLERLLLPDSLTLPLLAAGLLSPLLPPLGFDPPTLKDALLGAALGYAGFRLLALAYERLRGRAGLGGGDAKLVAAGGAWLGAPALPDLVLIGGLAGLLVAVLMGALRDPDRQVPFGPALALAFWLLFVAERTAG